MGVEGRAGVRGAVGGRGARPFAAGGWVSLVLAATATAVGAAPGDLDVGFGSGGVVTTAFGEAYSADQSFDRFDWKVGASYDVADAAMLYATIQTAYQPGTYNLFPGNETEDNLVDPAKLTAYTVGVKSRLVGDRLQINDELYYYDYRDLFVQSFNLNTALLTTFNADKVEIYGNQLDILLQASDNGRLNVTVGYLHARNEEFVVPPGINIGNFGGFSFEVLDQGGAGDIQNLGAAVQALVGEGAKEVA